MTYKIELDFHPLYELVSSMAVFIDQKTHYDLDKQWFETMEAKVSPTFLEKMMGEEKQQDIGFLMIMLRTCPDKTSLSAFIRWFQALSIGEIYEILAPYFGDCPLKDIGAFQDSYRDLLTEWSEVYSIKEESIKALDEITSSLKEEAQTMDPIEFVEKCTKGIRIFPMEDLQQVILVPSFHTAPLNRIYEMNHSMFVHFAVDEPSKDSITPSIGFMRKTKALADPKRLRILQFLSGEPKTFTEIGKEMKLSKSNLHYHLFLLRTAGLVRITNYKFKEPDKYETRPLGFLTLKEDIETYVFEKRMKL